MICPPEALEEARPLFSDGDPLRTKGYLLN